LTITIYFYNIGVNEDYNYSWWMGIKKERGMASMKKYYYFLI